MTNNELRQHKKRDGVKWFFTAVAFVLVFALIAGLCMQIFGKGKIQPSNWFKKPDTEQTQPETTDSGAIISPLKSNGIKLMSARVAPEEYADYGIDTQSVDSVFNLSVTYIPANTTFQETTYTLAFQNPNSTWAKGKNVTSYATVTQSAEGSKDAQLKILNAFSEKIIVTARNTRHSSIYATTTVDYVCSELSIGLVNSYVGVDDDIEISHVSWAGGTVTPVSAGNISIIFDFTSGFVNHMKNYGFTVPQTYEFVFNDAGDLEDGNFSFGTFYEYVKKVGNYDSLPNDRKAAYQNALCQFYADYSDGDGVCLYTFKYNRVYNGVNYGTVTDDDWCDLEGRNFSDCFEIAPASMAINNSHIIAG